MFPGADLATETKNCLLRIYRQNSPYVRKDATPQPVKTKTPPTVGSMVSSATVRRSLNRNYPVASSPQQTQPYVPVFREHEQCLPMMKPRSLLEFTDFRHQGIASHSAAQPDSQLMDANELLQLNDRLNTESRLSSQQSSNHFSQHSSTSSKYRLSAQGRNSISNRFPIQTDILMESMYPHGQLEIPPAHQMSNSGDNQNVSSAMDILEYLDDCSASATTTTQESSAHSHYNPFDNWIYGGPHKPTSSLPVTSPPRMYPYRLF
ncbi:uncharacterized protein LOC141913240 [Tubulanus polymorphus]|uniref:uncharacterized protein LOC141913240 n=1 Tax=Tubulanus polymorphus TaxID=672921 RepID=UPI003DA55F81